MNDNLPPDAPMRSYFFGTDIERADNRLVEVDWLEQSAAQDAALENLPVVVVVAVSCVSLMALSMALVFIYWLFS